MYSILTFFTALKVSDYIVDGFEKLISLTIISPNDKLVKERRATLKKCISVLFEVTVNMLRKLHHTFGLPWRKAKYF